MPVKLYDALQVEAGPTVDVSTFMDSWISQPGYPVLMVNASANRDTVTVRQTRFFRNYDGNRQESAILWHIPITFATNLDNKDFSSTQTSSFISDRSVEIKMPQGSVTWIVFNVQQSGMYIIQSFR